MSDFLPEGAASVVLRPELLAWGLTDREIGHLVRCGELCRVRRGAYVSGSQWASADPATRHALLTNAVVKQSRTEVVVSHASALPTYDAPTWRIPLDVVHLIRRDQRAGRKERGVRQHQGVLRDGDVVERNGLHVTGPDRTPLDVTTLVGVEPSLVVVNHFLHHRITTLERLRERYDGMRHDPHTLRTDLVLRLADQRIESVGESRTVFMCWRHSVPAPTPQWQVVDEHGNVVARLDFAWPELKCWMEFDGRAKYLRFRRDGESLEDAILREKQRESLICELTGWRCIRITWADLEQPERTVARILNFLRRTS